MHCLIKDANCTGMEFPTSVPILFDNEYYILYAEFPYLYITDLSYRGLKLEISYISGRVENEENYTVRLSCYKKQYQIQSYFKHELHQVLKYYGILPSTSIFKAQPTTFVCVLKQYFTYVKVYKNVYQTTVSLEQQLSLRSSGMFLQFPYTAIEKITAPELDTLQFCFAKNEVILQFSNKQLMQQFYYFLHAYTTLACYIYNSLMANSHLIKTSNCYLRNKIDDVDLSQDERIYYSVVKSKSEEVRGKIQEYGRMAALLYCTYEPNQSTRKFDTANAGLRAVHKKTDKKFVAYLCDTLDSQFKLQEKNSQVCINSGSSEFDDLGHNVLKNEIYQKLNYLHQQEQLNQLEVENEEHVDLSYTKAKDALDRALYSIKQISVRPTERQLLELQNLKNIKAQFGRVPEETLVYQIYYTLANFMDELSSDLNAFGSENSEICEENVNLGQVTYRLYEMQQQIEHTTQKLTALREKLADATKYPEKRQKIQDYIAYLESKLKVYQDEYERAQHLQITQISVDNILKSAAYIVTLLTEREYLMARYIGDVTNARVEEIYDEIDVFKSFLYRLSQAYLDELYELLDQREAHLKELEEQMAVAKDMSAKLRYTDDIGSQKQMRQFRGLHREFVRLTEYIENQKTQINVIELIMAGDLGRKIHIEEPYIEEPKATRKDVIRINKAFLEAARVVVCCINGYFVRCDMMCQSNSDGSLFFDFRYFGAAGCCTSQFEMQLQFYAIELSANDFREFAQDFKELFSDYRQRGEEEFKRRLDRSKSTKIDRKKTSDSIDGYYFRFPAVFKSEDNTKCLAVFDKDCGEYLIETLQEWQRCEN